MKSLDILKILLWERRSHSISYVGTPFPCVPAPLHHWVSIANDMPRIGVMNLERSRVQEVVSIANEMPRIGVMNGVDVKEAVRGVTMEVMTLV